MSFTLNRMSLSGKRSALSLRVPLIISRISIRGVRERVSMQETCVEPDSFSDCHAASILRDLPQARRAACSEEEAAAVVGDRFQWGRMVGVANFPRGVAERKFGDRGARRKRGNARTGGACEYFIA
jgi:hypothetical protein